MVENPAEKSADKTRVDAIAEPAGEHRPSGMLEVTAFIEAFFRD